MLIKKEAKSFEEKTMPLFQQFEFKKSVCNHIIIDGKEQKVFGSIWKFTFNYLNLEQQKLIQFGLDAGFGERNSLGFGFMNIIKNNVQKEATFKETAG